MGHATGKKKQHPLLVRHRAYSRLAMKFAGQANGTAYEKLAAQALREYHRRHPPREVKG